MLNRLIKTINTSAIIVFLFGVFVLISLSLQCFVPFIALLVEKFGYTGTWVGLFNKNFTLPIEMISNFYIVIISSLIGIDRGAMAIATFKSGHPGDEKVGNVESLKQIIFQSLVIYVWAVLLYMLFDVDLSLTQFFIAFGSSVALFVGGNKCIKTASQLAPEEDLNNDGIRDSDQFTEEELNIIRGNHTIISQMISTIKSGQQITAAISPAGKILFKEIKKPS